EQLTRLEARDVGAVSLPDLEHPRQRECPHGLTERVAGEPELLREIGLARQPHPGLPLAGGHELPDPLHRVVGDAGAAPRPRDGRYPMFAAATSGQTRVYEAWRPESRHMA